MASSRPLRGPSRGGQNNSDTSQDHLFSHHDNSTTSVFTKILSVRDLIHLINATTLSSIILRNCCGFEVVNSSGIAEYR